MSNKQLIIIRGPSGTGKTTLASHLGGIQFYNWFEADMWMFDPQTGKYCFKRENLADCHRRCQTSADEAMRDGIGPVIVSNTACSLRELRPYLDLAKAHGYSVRIIRTAGPWRVEELLARNIHDVPREAMQRFIDRYRAHDDEEEWTDLTIYG